MTDKADDTAPAFAAGAQHLPWWRRAVAQGAGYYLPSLAFVAMPVAFSLDLPLGQILLTAALSVVVGVLFIGTTLVMHWSEERRWLWLLALILSLIALGVGTGGEGRAYYFSAYVTTTAAALHRWEAARVLIPAVSIVAAGIAWLNQDLFGVVMAVVALALGLSIGQGIEGERTRERLRAAEERTAVLAVAAERERIGRDLHDILGHSLTTIAVKGDLAARLVGRDDDAARAQVEEVTAIARQALADVRATASGLKEVRLASEIASARSVLTAAGIEPVTPTALPTLSDQTSELLGYVVRESVTNVVRHSGAATCTIDVDDLTVSVTDDGNGSDDLPIGNGLAGLRTRVERAGGLLTIDSSKKGTTITATAPEAA